MRINQILVPVDFSPHAHAAVLAAADLARRYQASLTLLHVWGPVAFLIPEGFVLYTPTQLTKMMSEFEALLARAKADAENAGASQVETVQREGVVAAEISALARDGNYDLIVIGSHGRTGLRHALLGSVAEKVLRESPCPVLTIKLAANPPA